MGLQVLCIGNPYLRVHNSMMGEQERTFFVVMGCHSEKGYKGKVVVEC